MGGGWSTPCPGRFTPGKETWYWLYRTLGGWVWTGMENLALTRIQSPDHPPRCTSLHWLHHPSSQHTTQKELNSFHKDDVYLPFTFSVYVSCLAAHSILLSPCAASQFCSIFSLLCEIFPICCYHLYLSLPLGHVPFIFVFQNFEIHSSSIFELYTWPPYFVVCLSGCEFLLSVLNMFVSILCSFLKFSW